MKIHNTTHTTFKANPLFKINLATILPDGNKSFISAHFSELSNKNKTDIELAQKLKSEWKRGNEDFNLTTVIAKNFLDKDTLDKFYIVEIDDKSLDLFSRTKSIMQTTNPKEKEKDFFEIGFLQSKSGLKNPKLEPNPIKGAGELSVYGAIKLAWLNDFRRLFIHSFQNEFYKKIGLEEFYEMGKDEAVFILYRNDFIKFLKKIRKKYDMY